MTSARLYPAMVDLLRSKVLVYFAQCEDTQRPSAAHRELYELMAVLQKEIQRVYPLPTAGASAVSAQSPTAAAVAGAAPSKPALPSTPPPSFARAASTPLQGSAAAAAPIPASPPTPSASSSSSSGGGGQRGRLSSGNDLFVLSPAAFKKYEWRDEQCRVCYDNAALLALMLECGGDKDAAAAAVLSEHVLECAASARQSLMAVSKRLQAGVGANAAAGAGGGDDDEAAAVMRELISAQEAGHAVVSYHIKLVNGLLAPGTEFKLPPPPVTATTNADGTRKQHPLFYNQPHSLRHVSDSEKRFSDSGVAAAARLSINVSRANAPAAAASPGAAAPPSPSRNSQPGAPPSSFDSAAAAAASPASPNTGGYETPR
jgi:hypothetical protein